MNKDLYSNQEFTELKHRLNQEIQRRSTFSWWDPLTTPSVGEDKSSPMSLPDIGQRVSVDDKTYTINNPSEGSIERTKNIHYQNHGDSPSGDDSEFISTVPNTSAAKMDADEMRNFLVGLSKIKDINLFYGRDEIPGLAYRDPSGIEEVLTSAEKDKLHEYIVGEYSKNDPNNGANDHLDGNYPSNIHEVHYDIENGIAVMKSGEYDGEELNTHDGLGPNNFFDDYGAEPGDGDFHPYNRGYTPQSRRDWKIHNNQRKTEKVYVTEGGIPTSSFGPNPRNPVQGKEYKSRPVFKGSPSTCQVACTGLCSVTCDDQCSESCSSTCWSRCGNACTSSCGNACTGCSTLCYTSCKTKCENISGYACVTAGAKAIKITTSGGTNGVPAKNEIQAETYSCQGCSYSCQFYPNKKTTCWDAGCMGNCFISCNTACSTACTGGCINNTAEEGTSYKTGKGRGCSSGCTLNCIGNCSGTCEGQCVTTCWHACKETCTDNCTFECSTNCGSGCASGCKDGCTGCTGTCESYCEGQTDSIGCTGCSTKGGCTSTCQHGCNKNCVGIGCRSICGIEAAGACEANCRINCMSSSCSAMCSNQCSDQCTTCVNTCGFGCGYCSSVCSSGCDAACEITCSEKCEHSCENNCVQSCSEECGGCSSLCFSCVGMCIGVCSVHCENGCTSCSVMCGWWCDSSCNQQCFANCDTFCISDCSGSCITFLMSKANTTIGPENNPTAEGYKCPHPSNREEERESFIIRKDE